MSASESKDRLAAFHVPWGHHVYSELIHRTSRFWRWLGDIESDSIRETLDQTPIDRPIYVAGLARSGSTILIEALACHPEVVTHRYRDYWSCYTPYWYEQVCRGLVHGSDLPKERSHGDGLFVTPNSPEAIEEILWMSFFAGIHDRGPNSILDARTSAPRFERYYTDHVRKLIVARNRTRYASKANYHITRLEYLLKLFPDVRIVLPVRAPRDHIASLRKQHELLVAAARRYPRSVMYLDRVGHFEFGKHRRPIHLGDSTRIREIEELWQSGCQVRGWARYWALVHDYLYQQMESNSELRNAIHVIRYEDLCDDPLSSLSKLFDHCGLYDNRTHLSSSQIEEFANLIRKPTYYTPQFSNEEESAIVEETEVVAAKFGYFFSEAPAAAPIFSPSDASC